MFCQNKIYITLCKPVESFQCYTELLELVSELRKHWHKIETLCEKSYKKNKTNKTNKTKTANLNEKMDVTCYMIHNEER